MINIIKWFAGFFSDGNNQASSKRLATYIALFFLYLIVKGELNGKTVSQELLFVIAGIVLFGIGAVTSEFITKSLGRKNEK